MAERAERLAITKQNPADDAESMQNSIRNGSIIVRCTLWREKKLGVAVSAFVKELEVCERESLPS